MNIWQFMGQFPFLAPVVAILVVLLALGTYKLIREFFPW